MSWLQRIVALIRAVMARGRARELYDSAKRIRAQLEFTLEEKRREEFVAHCAVLDAEKAVKDCRRKLGWHFPEEGEQA